MVRAALVILIIIAVATTPHAQTIAPVANAAGLSAAASPGPPGGGGAPPPSADSTTVQLLVGRSTVLNVGTPISRVSLTTPEVADALVTSPQQVLIHGKAPGTISLFVWDRAGAIRTYEVVVQRDLSNLGRQYKQLFPGENIFVSSNGKDVVISGSVTSQYAIDKAAEVAIGYVEKKENVVNLLQLQQGVATNQVLLRVRFAEVSRSALQELGASLFTSPIGVKNTIGRVTTQQFPAPGFEDLEWTKNSDKFGAPVTSAKGKFTFSDFLNIFLLNQRYDLGTMVRALESRGFFQSLAEPNLIAQNGREASFLAGGEFPYPVVQSGGGFNAVTLLFKEFGIRLSFTPTILGNGLIHLKVRPEVSSLDFSNAVVIEGFRVPALSTRRADTEVELRDGQTFAIAGLLNNNVTQTMQKIPGIGDIPILGLLFKSRALQKGQTELVVMITPQIVRADSMGAAPSLPNLVTPYMEPPKKTLPPPPPYGSRPDGSGQAAPAPRPTSTPVAAPVNAAVPASPQPRAANAEPGTNPEPGTTNPHPEPGTRSPEPDRKSAERLRKEQERQREIDARRQADAAKAAKAAAEKSARKAEEDRKRREKIAREQAKRDAEAAKRAAEDRKKQDEEERKRQKVRAEAEAKLRAAQQAYQQELDRIRN